MSGSRYGSSYSIFALHVVIVRIGQSRSWDHEPVGLLREGVRHFLLLVLWAACTPSEHAGAESSSPAVRSSGRVPAKLWIVNIPIPKVHPRLGIQDELLPFSSGLAVLRALS